MLSDTLANLTRRIAEEFDHLSEDPAATRRPSAGPRRMATVSGKEAGSGGAPNGAPTRGTKASSAVATPQSAEPSTESSAQPSGPPAAADTNGGDDTEQVSQSGEAAVEPEPRQTASQHATSADRRPTDRRPADRRPADRRPAKKRQPGDESETADGAGSKAKGWQRILIN